MPGLPILHRVLMPGFNEPTRLYACVDDNGELRLIKEIDLKGIPLEYVIGFLKEVAIAPHKPVFVDEAYPQIRHELKSRGIRVL